MHDRHELSPNTRKRKNIHKSRRHPATPNENRAYLLHYTIELHQVSLSNRLREGQVRPEGSHETLLVEHRTLRDLSEEELTAVFQGRGRGNGGERRGGGAGGMLTFPIS